MKDAVVAAAALDAVSAVVDAMAYASFFVSFPGGSYFTSIARQCMQRQANCL